MKIINKEKGYLWPFDKLCWNCCSKIHLSKSSDFDKVSSNNGEIQYYCTCPKCKERYIVHPDQIPEEIRNEI